MSANSRSILPEDMDFLGPDCSQLALVATCSRHVPVAARRPSAAGSTRICGRLGAAVGGVFRKSVLPGPILRSCLLFHRPHR